MQFVYDQLPGRVVFGVGALDSLAREIGLLGAQKALVLSTPGHQAQAEDVAQRLGTRCAGIFPRAMMHVPVETARAAREEARRLGADAAQGLYDLPERLGARMALKDIGMKQAELDRAAELATQSPYYNPRAIDRAAIRKLLDDAYHGRRPN